MKTKQIFVALFITVVILLTAITASAASPYSDVSEKFWGYNDVVWATEQGLMVGTSGTKFSPNTNMSRAMLAAVLWRYEGEPSADPCSFTDVKRDFWYTDSIDWAAENGIVYGMTDTTFSPNGNITREQLVTILYRYANSINIDTSARDDLSKFADNSKVSDWASEAMQWAVAEELIQGITQNNVINVSPRGNATRAQVAAILHRFDKQTKCVDGKEHTIVVDGAIAPTCTETGLTEGNHCSVCDRVFVAQNTISALGHTVGEWITDAESTCIETGSKHQICSACTVTINTETIAAKGHTETEKVIENKVDPTCIADGFYDTVVYCSVCEIEISRETITVDALGHIDGEWITDVNATCTETGNKHQICSICSVTINTETVAAKGHSEGESVIENSVNPDCVNEGSYDNVIYCKACNEELSRKNIILEALGHTDGEWITDTNATCTEDGNKYQVCLLCNATIKTELIAAKGHSYSMTITNRDCGNNAKKVYTCGTCNHSYDEEISPISLSFRHTSTSSSTVNGYGSYSKGYAVTVKGGYGKVLLKYELYTSKTATNPTSTIDFTTDTATSVSFRGYANAIDNYVYKITAKDEVGNISIYRFSLKDESLIDYEHKGEVEHTFSDWSVTKESTCSEYGERQNACSVCNNIITDVIEKKPHTAVVDEAVPSNCLQTGLTEGSHCSVCETVIVAQEETPTGEHSYENKICICGRDVADIAIETYDLSQKQDGSIMGYLISTTGGQKLYVLGSGATKDYKNSETSVTPFKQNKTITEIYFSDGINSIGDYLFYFCTNLKVVHIPQSTTYIGKFSFYYCSLKNLTLPEGLVKISTGAFGGNDLFGVVLPTTLQYIGDDAFKLCNLTRVYIPQNVTHIGAGAFSWNELVEISVDKNNSKYHSINDCIIDTSAKVLIVGCKNSSIPADGSVTCIGDSAFEGSELSSIIIPDSITKIKGFAFTSCDLKTVIIPSSVTVIGYNAFFLCDYLTTIYCKASNKPSGWDSKWNQVDNYPETYATVVWEYTE